MKKQFITTFIILFCIVLELSPVYIFNHYNAWLGILTFIIFTIFSINIINKLFFK